MVLSMLVTLRDQGIPLPAGAILISPWVDLTHSFPSLGGDGKMDYIPAHGFVHKPSMSWRKYYIFEHMRDSNTNQRPPTLMTCSSTIACEQRHTEARSRLARRHQKTRRKTAKRRRRQSRIECEDTLCNLEPSLTWRCCLVQRQKTPIFGFRKMANIALAQRACYLFSSTARCASRSKTRSRCTRPTTC